MKKNISIAFIVWLVSIPLLFAQITPGKTDIPDDNFEIYLETHDKDGVGVSLGDLTSMGDGISGNHLVFTDRIVLVESLDISGLNIANLAGLQYFTILETLNFSNNRVAGSPIIQNTTLKNLLCSSNELTGLNISASTLLTNLDCSSNQLATFSVTSNTLLEILTCSDNQLTTIDITNNLELVSLGVSNNRIGYNNPLYILDVSNNLKLINLSCASNQLNSLNISSNNLLESVDLSNNFISKDNFVGLNTCVDLSSLDISANKFDDINLSNLPRLKSLRSDYNQFTSFDLSSKDSLIVISFIQNQLKTLNIKNGKNLNLTYLNVTNNPKLYCVQVDDAFVPNGAITGWFKDDLPFKIYSSTTCENLTYVPDDAFEQTLIDLGYDSGPLDNFVLTANIETVTSLTISGLAFTNLTGIEDFIALQNLNCSATNINGLDLSKNSALTTLTCTNNSLLTDLDLRSNISLTTIDCSNNALVNLKLGNNSVLTTLNCAGNSLTSLDVSKNLAITSLDCSNNNTLSNLNLGSNSVLTTLTCNNNLLTSLDVSKNTALTSIVCSFNKLTSLNLGSNNVLTTLDCSTNLLVGLNMSKNLGLTTVNCSSNSNLTSLNLGSNTVLTTLDCSKNSLTSLDVSKNTALTSIDCSTNQLSSLNLDSNTLLTTLYCSTNSLITLDVSNNSAITSFDARVNNLTCINVHSGVDFSGWLKDEPGTNFSTNCNTTYVPDDAFETYLETHNIDGEVETTANATTWVSMGDGIMNNFVPTNKIAGVTVLDVQNQVIKISDLTGIQDFTALLDLNCSTNSIVSLDLSGNTNLTTLDCSDNSLVRLDVSINNAITSFDARINPNLFCIKIDLSADKTAWLKDATASYNSNCNTTYVPDDAFEAFLELNGMGDGIDNNNFVSTDKISSVTVLDINTKGIADLTGIEDFSSLQDLNCATNSLIYLDLSSNTDLTTLNCATNQINSLNISGNTALITIDCSANLLTDLDFGSNPNLTSLNCNNNLLNSLNLKNGQNGILNVFDTTSNPDLYCIEVDTAFAPAGGIGWQKDAIALYSTVICASRQTYVPDDAFEQALIDLGYDSILDDNVYTENIEGLTTLDISRKNIFNLIGIEDFRSLNELNCSNNYLVDLNVQSNTALTALNCGGNNLATLNVTQNTNLVELLCDANNLTIPSDLDISQNTDLERLNCSSNNLTSLDLTANINLQKLVCANNKLTTLNGINSNANLTDLDCSNNYLSSISISGNGALMNLNCSNNSLTGLSTTDNTNLRELYCDVNQIATLNLNTNNLLHKLNGASNKLEGLNLASNTALDTLNISKNKISTISLATNTNLISLNISKNELASLLLNSNNLLEYVNISDNLLTSLNLSNTPSNLITLICNKNKLSTIDFTNNTAIEELNISANQFTAINVSSLTSLIKFYGNSNQLTEQDLNSNIALTNVNVSENNLFSLKIRNLNNASLLEFNTLNNPDLYCIEVDDAFASVVTPGWTKDLIASYTIDCRYNITDVPDANFEAYLEANGMGDDIPNNNIVFTDRIRNVLTLDISVQGIADLTGIEDFTALQSLDCSGNSIIGLVLERNIDLTILDCNNNTLLTSLDLSSNTALTTLNCNNNVILASLDLSSNTALTTLTCSNNTFGSLNVDSNTALTTLSCNDNNLSDLNLTNNTAIEVLDISSNQLVEIDVTELTNLKDINGSFNEITDLNLSLNPLLTNVNFDSNQLMTLNIKNGNNTAITSFNVLNNPILTCIEVDNPTFSNGAAGWLKDVSSECKYLVDCHYGEFNVPDVAFEQALIYLGFDSGPLDHYVPNGTINTETSLILSNKGITDLTGIAQFTNLVILDIRNNNLGTIDLTSNLLLETLKCSVNQLVSLDVSANTQLRYLDVSNNILDNLDVSANSNLNELNCSYNQLTDLVLNLDGVVNSILEILDCSQNQLTNLDVSMVTNLTDLDTSSNELLNLDIKNGNNSSLLNLDIQYNPNLWCVLVDDIDLARGYVTWLKDSTTFYKLECVDSDDDGVPDGIDACPNTPFGAVVDVFGCQYFSLPASNFTVLITGETCITSNNGKINIVAEETLNYTATVVGVGFSNTYKFTKDLDIFNLRAGAYELCITIDDEPSYSICYDITVSEPQAFFVSSKVSHSEKKVSLELSGGTTYTINFNGLIFNTTDSKLSLSLSKGTNTIEVKTDLECQGAHKESIFLSDEVLIYPNPFEDFINVFTGNNETEKFDINIYSYIGQLVLSKPQSVKKDVVTLDTSNLPTGIYFVALKSNKSLLTFKIIKK